MRTAQLDISDGWGGGGVVNGWQLELVEDDLSGKIFATCHLLM